MNHRAAWSVVEMTQWVKEYLPHKHENLSLESLVNSGVT